MKLAAALMRRADLQTQINELQMRLNNNARVQEGEKPAEAPADLLAALDAAIAVYQLENGKDPQAVSDLKEYISDIGRLKPPHGDCKLSDGTVLPMTSGKYELKKGKEEGTNIENMRATCEGHTSGEFGHGGVKSEPAS